MPIEYSQLKKTFNERYRKLEGDIKKIILPHMMKATAEKMMRCGQLTKTLFLLLYASENKYHLNFDEIKLITGIQPKRFKEFVQDYFIEEINDNTHKTYVLTHQGFLESVNRVLIESQYEYQKELEKISQFFKDKLWFELLKSPYPGYKLFTFEKIEGEAKAYAKVKDFFDSYENIFIYSDLLWAAFPDEAELTNDSVKFYYKTVRNAMEKDIKKIHCAVCLRSHFLDRKEHLSNPQISKEQRKEYLSNTQRYLNELLRFNKKENITIRDANMFMGLTVISAVNDDKTIGEVIYITDVGEPEKQPVIRSADLKAALSRARWHEELENNQNNKDFENIVQSFKCELKELR